MTKKSPPDYDVKRFREFVEPLLEERNESYRQASMSANLDETAISRYFRGTQPVRDACIALADHFGINPNEMLKAAGYDPLHFFDRRLIDPNAIPPDVEQFLGEIMKIENETIRKEMIDALRQVLKVQMMMREDALGRTAQQVQEAEPQTSEAASS
jgi:hypothetical protein